MEVSVLREVAEEYGCQGKILEQLPAHSIHRQHDGKATHWVAIPFVIKVNSNEVRNNEPDKIDELGWFRPAEFPEPLHVGFQQTMSRYKYILEKYGA